MFSIFTHVTKSVRDTNSESGLPLVEGLVSCLFPVEIMFIMEAHPWLCSMGFLAGFVQCKILLEISIVRVKTRNRAWGAVFKVQGPVTTSIEVLGGGGGGWWKQIWLFSLCGCLVLSDYWTFLESLLSRVMFIIPPKYTMLNQPNVIRLKEFRTHRTGRKGNIVWAGFFQEICHAVCTALRKWRHIAIVFCSW